MIVKLKLKDQPEFEIASVNELTYLFNKNVLYVEWKSATGPMHSEYEISQLESFDHVHFYSDSPREVQSPLPAKASMPPSK